MLLFALLLYGVKAQCQTPTPILDWNMLLANPDPVEITELASQSYWRKPPAKRPRLKWMQLTQIVATRATRRPKAHHRAANIATNKGRSPLAMILIQELSTAIWFARGVPTTVQVGAGL